MLRLTYYGTTSIPVEAEVITPDGLAGKSPLEISHLPVQHGNAPAPLGEFFQVEGDGAGQEIVIDGDCSRVKLLGARMKSGTLTILGDAGMHVGAEMTGGSLHVRGNAGDWAGAEMRGGLLHIRGDAGHLVGAAYRGSRHGMRGGILLVHGNAGNEIGATMRRGLIAIGGECGDFPGVGMIAGSLLVFGKSGLRPGANMKRGTIAFFAEPPPLLPTFRFACAYQPAFMRLYLQHLAALDFSPAWLPFEGVYHRYAGDLVSLGQGEILIRRLD